MNDDRPLVEVVCAVIQKPTGEFLLAQRPVGKVYEGYWEFPGGKVDPGETIAQATVRELDEELDIVVEESYPWLTRKFSYPHAHVRLHFRRVTRWRNAPRGRENQAFAWQTISNISVSPLLPANGPILAGLALPTIYGITNATDVGVDEMLYRLERALDKGLRLIQIREKTWSAQRLSDFSLEVINRARRVGAKVLLNGDLKFARKMNADGAHLTANQLLALNARPNFALCGASCHNQQELAKAEELGLDFVVLGPVLPTPSHPDSPALGWDDFTELSKNYSLPIFALGGLSTDYLGTAWQRGAHGLAMMRGAWTD